MEKAMKLILFLHMYLGAILTMGQTIGLRIPDTTVVEGQEFTIPVYVDSSLTGKGVYSYRLEIHYSDYYFKALNANTTATVAGQFGSMVVNLSETGKIILAGAGTEPLTGKGIFLNLQFQAIQNGAAYISFAPDLNKSYFNEGIPGINFKNGYITLSQSPEIYLQPNSASLLRGDSLQMTVSGDTAHPFSFSVVNPDIGDISTSGMFYATSPGKTKIRVEDAEGLTDETNSEFEVFGFRLSSPTNLKQWQGGMIDIPVNTSELAGLQITSGSFTFTFNENILSFVEVIDENTLLEGISIATQEEGNSSLKVGFASTHEITGNGTLLYLRFAVSPLNTGYSSLTYSNVVFNESLTGLSIAGQFQTINFANIALTPNSGTLLAGDSIQIIASNGVNPYFFETSNTEIATINSNGMLKAIQGGTVQAIVRDSVGAQKTSGNFIIYDTYIEVPDTTGPVNSIFQLPIFIGSLPSGKSISSFEISLTFSSPLLEFLNVVTLDALTEGWSMAQSVEGNKINISGAGTQPIDEQGVLCFLTFNLTSNFAIGNYAYISITKLLLNEGTPTALISNGSIKGTLSEDLGVSAIISPVSGCNLSTHEMLTVEIKNYGYIDYQIGDTILVGFTLNNGSPVTDTLVLDTIFASGTTLTFTFTDFVDLSAAGTFTLNCYTLLGNEWDGNPNNNFYQVEILSSPGITINLGPDQFTCQGDTLKIIADLGFTTYEWSTGTMNQTEVQITETSQVWLKVTNSMGCEANDTVQLTFHPKPETPVITVTDTVLCEGDSVTVSAPPGFTGYLWNNGSTESFIDVSQGGNYTVVVFNEFNCLSNPSDSVSIILNSLPIPRFNFTVNSLEVTFENNSTHATSYTWDFGDGNNSNEAEPIHVYTEASNFMVSLTAANDFCGDSTLTKTLSLGENLAPVVENPITDLQFEQGFGSYKIILSEVFSDPNGDPITYSFSNDNSSVISVLIQNDTLLLTEVGIGIAQISVTATDDELLSVTDQFSVLVNTLGNIIPVVTNPLPDIELNEGFSTHTIDVSNVFTDADNDPLTFTSQQSNDSVGSISFSGSNLLIQEEGAGVLEITVFADDGKGGVAFDTFVLQVIPNSNTAPEISNQSFSVNENSAFATSVGMVLASDADNDALTFNLSSGNTGDAFTLNPSTGLLSVNNSLMLDFETTPVFILTVEAFDGKISTSALVTINILDVAEETTIQQNSGKAPFTLFPNPATKEVILFSDYPKHTTRFSILNQQGQIVFESSIIHTEQPISLEAFPKGVYLVLYQTGAIQYIQKLISRSLIWH